MPGKVKFYNKKKGFGFITDDNGGEDLFFHVTEVQGGQALNNGDAVNYDTEEGKKGLVAKNVSKV